jgi:serine/threonine-protein kinase
MLRSLAGEYVSPSSDGVENTFGRIAIAQGFATPKQVEDSVEAMRKLAELGFRERLGEVMVKKGFLTTQQVKDILRLQGARAANRIKGYEILTKLGQGGMGAVFKARQKSLDRMVALKILAPHLAKDKVYVERFLREARAVAKLNHPNIIQGIDVGESDRHYYFAMEFVDGPTVADVLRSDGPLDEKRALRITLEIAQALENAYEHGLVHRDVKPDNIMLTAGGEAKLCDLGLAKSASASEPGATNSSRVVMGTPHYISPEQAKGEQDIDTRADIYSLGATLFHMLTGRTPFEGTSPPVIMTKHLTDLVDDPCDLVPDLSEDVALLINKMMAKHRDDRYETPTDHIADIKAVMAGKEPSCASEGALGVALPSSPTPMPEIKRHRTRHAPRRSSGRQRQAGGMLFALGAVVIAVGAGLALLPGRGRPRGTRSSSSGNTTRPPSGSQMAVSGGAGVHSKEDNAKFLFEQASAFAKAPENAERFEAVVSEYQTVQTVGANTEYANLATIEINRWRRRKRIWQTKQVDKARADALAYAERGEYQRAMGVWDRIPKSVLDPDDERAKKILEFERRAIVTHGLEVLRVASEEAHALVAEGKTKDARRRLMKAASVNLDIVEGKYASAKRDLEDAIKKKLGRLRASVEAEWEAGEDEVLELARTGEFAAAEDKAKALQRARKFGRWRERAKQLADDMRRMALQQELALEGIATQVGSQQRISLHKGARGYSAKITDVSGNKITISPLSSTAQVVVIKVTELSADDIRRLAPIKLSSPAGHYDYAILLFYMGAPKSAKPHFEKCRRDAVYGPKARIHLATVENGGL